MPAAVPNKNNNPQLNTTQSDVADASIKNFLKGVAWPPTTEADKIKMKAAIEAFKTQIKKTKDASSKKAGTLGKTGKAAATKSLVSQAVDKIGTSIPDLGKFLPAGTSLGNVTFDAAIASMEATVAKLEQLTTVPASTFPAPSNATPTAQVQSLSAAGQAEAAAQAAAAAAAQIQPKQTIGAGGSDNGEAVNVRNV